ncbi:exodeoxyribonuclease VII large subunit [Candidatus Saccharibacteria bacterium]|nr:exodeoxyribonuclease VII large subunit [Candidatus Saccharibacteria bacterium]
MTLLNDTEIIWSVSDFVAVFNQTIEFAYPSVTIIGELINFKTSKNKWIYFDLKDEQASIRFFGTVYSLPGPLEGGMMVQVYGNPRLHPQFGFSITVRAIQAVGEGSIKKAAQLLEAKLKSEGLFELDRKRTIPYPPNKIALICSSESAAYHDFIKIINNRWKGIAIELYDVQVQGEDAPFQIVRALEQANAESNAEVIVLTRGGGSQEDLSVFSNEVVVRSVAASRIPTVVAIGHEIDICLAEMASDKRASTPSNAAEIIVPDKISVQQDLQATKLLINHQLDRVLQLQRQFLTDSIERLNSLTLNLIRNTREEIKSINYLIGALSPNVILNKGYALVFDENKNIVNCGERLDVGQNATIKFIDYMVDVKVIRKNKVE